MSTTRITCAIFLVAIATAVVVGLCTVEAAAAAGPELQGTPPTQDCTTCHSDLAQQWQSSKHAIAFSGDAFKKTWAEGGNQKYCLTCHTTGYDANTDKYVQEGVTCQACHKPAGTNGHPGGAMTVSDSAEFCGTCHTTTFHEWQKGGHGKANIACRSCHDMHSTTLRVTSRAICAPIATKSAMCRRTCRWTTRPSAPIATCTHCPMPAKRKARRPRTTRSS